MLQKRTRRLGFAIMWVLPFVLSAHTHAGEKPPPYPSDSIVIIDLNGNKVALTPEDIKAMPAYVESKCICVGEKTGFIGIYDYSGVRLSDVLAKAPALQGASGYRKENLYLIFKGTDEYQVVASYNELTQNAEGRRAMVVLEKDGKPLSPDEGAFRLHFPGDKYVGRSVKCLHEIEIKSADGVVEFGPEK